MARAPRAPAPANGAAVFMAKPDEEAELAAEDEAAEAPEEAAEAAELVALARAPLMDEEADARALEADEDADATAPLADEAAEAAAVPVVDPPPEIEAPAWEQY